MKKVLLLLVFVTSFFTLPSLASTSGEEYQYLGWEEKEPDKADELYLALLDKNKKKAVKIIKAGADVNKNYSYKKVDLYGNERPPTSFPSLPMLAMQNNWPDVFEIMIEHDLDTKNPYILGSLVALGWYDMVKHVISCDADVNSSSHVGKTPLMLAQDEKMLKLLLSYGAKVDSTDEEGKTALHHQVFMNRRNNVQTLLDHGANVNAIDNDGETPLHHTRALICFTEKEAQKTISVAQILIAAGADTSIKNIYGESAFHNGAASSHPAVQEFFLSLILKEIDRLKAEELIEILNCLENKR